MNNKPNEKQVPAAYAFPEEDRFGFAGTLRSNYDTTKEVTRRIWLYACERIEKAFAEKEPRIVRNFLRARYGRHLADDLSFRMHGTEPSEDEIKIALDTTDWKAWASWYREVRKYTLAGQWDET